MFFTSVKIKTDEITSDTVTSDLVEEHNSWLLYYTYETIPQAAFSEKNPAQYGTTRLEIEKPQYYFETVKHLAGKYWTTGKTIGDMKFQRELEQ